jgi:hypothetical protein
MTLRKIISFSSAFAVVCGSLCLAQSAPPDRIGNVWNGVKHQPTREEVRDAEKKADAALDNRNKIKEDKELDAISKQLLAKEH